MHATSAARGNTPAAGRVQRAVRVQSLTLGVPQQQLILRALAAVRAERPPCDLLDLREHVLVDLVLAQVPDDPCVA